MKIRDVVLQDRLAQPADTRTWTFNINLVDPVTEFKIWFFAQNGASKPGATGRSCIPYQIDEIAIVDGSEVIASMNGAEAFAMYCFDHGKPPFIWEQELAGMSQYWCIPITFGRHLWDPEWIFDPTRFRNPQIRISFSTLIAAAEYATLTTQISVWAKVMEEGANPRGYLMNKELKEFASLASGQEITYLPTDFPHRKLMIRSYGKCAQMNDAITRLKLSQDEDKWIPWDLNSHDFIFLMRDWFPEYHFHMKKFVDNAEEREHYGGTYAHLKAVAGTDDTILALRGGASNCVQFLTEGAAGSARDDVEAWLDTWTRTPFDCYCYPFGDQDDAEDWLQVRDMGNLRLILTQGGTGQTIEVVVQQAHPY